MDFKTYQYLARYSLGKPGAISAYRNSKKCESLSESSLSEISWNKTQKLLQEAYENVPWYNHRFKKEGLHPNDISSPDYFYQVPVLTRNELTDNFELFKSKKANPESLKISTTGGSTGIPLKIGMQKRVIREIPKWQMLSWWGLPPSVNMATLYRGVPTQRVKKLALDFIKWPQKVIRMDATQMTTNNIRSFIQNLNKIQPKLIHGYVGALDAVADYVIEHRISFTKAPEVIWSTASPISAVQEAKITQAFGAPVCDQYGCSELYFISAECHKKEGLHIFWDSVKLEVLNSQNVPLPKNEYGKLVLTNLNDFHFPLIRYENGDEGRLLDKRCSCGMSLPLMDKVRGRQSDNLMLPDGTVLAGEYLTTIFDDYTNDVKQFQIIQKKDKSIHVKIVLKQLENKLEILYRTETELEKRIKNSVKLDIQFVEEIQFVKGKLQFIVKE